MEIQIEFDYGGRTYSVKSASIPIWNIYTMAQLNDKMSIETDLHTGDKIFVT